MLYWWNLFDTDEIRSDAKDLSFQFNNCEQHDEGTISAYRLWRVIELLADIFA
jgi:hypothetical protein